MCSCGSCRLCRRRCLLLVEHSMSSVSVLSYLLDRRVQEQRLMIALRDIALLEITPVTVSQREAGP